MFIIIIDMTVMIMITVSHGILNQLNDSNSNPLKEQLPPDISTFSSNEHPTDCWYNFSHHQII